MKPDGELKITSLNADKGPRELKDPAHLTDEDIQAEMKKDFQPGTVRLRQELQFHGSAFELNIKDSNVELNATYYLEVDGPDGMIYEFHGVQPLENPKRPGWAIFDVDTAKVHTKRIPGQ